MRGILLHLPGVLFLLAGASPDPAATTELEPARAPATEIEPAPELEVGTSPPLAGKIGATEVEEVPHPPSARDIEAIPDTKHGKSAVTGTMYPGRTWNADKVAYSSSRVGFFISVARVPPR